MLLEEVISQLKTLAHLEAVENMYRIESPTDHVLGVSLAGLRKFAKKIDKNHNLAQQLWNAGFYETRVLAAFIDEPDKVTERQMDRWIRESESSELCDVCCGNLFDKTPWAYQKAVEWTGKSEELIKRSGFMLMAELAVHDKKTQDEEFIGLLEIIKREASEERSLVKKAIGLALRQIGKRNANLNTHAVETSTLLSASEFKPARIIGQEALRELTDAKLLHRLQPFQPS